MSVAFVPSRCHCPRPETRETWHVPPKATIGWIWSRSELGKVRGKILLPGYSEQTVQGCCDVDAVLAVRFDGSGGEGEEEKSGHEGTFMVH